MRAIKSSHFHKRLDIFLVGYKSGTKRGKRVRPGFQMVNCYWLSISMQRNDKGSVRKSKKSKTAPNFSRTNWLNWSCCRESISKMWTRPLFLFWKLFFPISPFFATIDAFSLKCYALEWHPRCHPRLESNKNENFPPILFTWRRMEKVAKLSKI